eukprot:gene18707-6062_t
MRADAATAAAVWREWRPGFKLTKKLPPLQSKSPRSPAAP